MTEEQARRLWDYTTTALGDNNSRMHQLGNGEWVVRIRAKDYFLWGFEDWTVYAHDLKAKAKAERKAQRRDVQRAIDTQESYRLVLA